MSSPLNAFAAFNRAAWRPRVRYLKLEWGFPGPHTFTVFVVVATIIAFACACGGVSQGLTTPGALAPRAGTTIAPGGAVTIVFHRPLDKTTIGGNLFVTQDGENVPYYCVVRDDGYTLIVRPMYYALHNGKFEISLIGGEQGIRYADGRGFDSITLTYFVRNQ